MSVKRVTQTKKPKKAQITKASKLSIEYKYIGDEPLDISIKGYVSALNWYHYMFDVEQAREWLLEYMKKNSYPREDIACARRASKHMIPTTVGWIARMKMNGNVLDNDSYFNSRLNDIVQAGKREEKEVVADDVPTLSIQERTRIKNNKIIASIEEELDNDPNFSIYTYLKANEITVSAASDILNYYTPIHEEVMSDDDQVKEAFGKKLKEERKFWQSFVDDCSRFIDNNKVAKVRKPREKKTKSAVDLVKTLNYQKEFPELKIVSVNPAEIIGCQQLWVYNTKDRKLIQYIAQGPSGLGVKGTTLTGFDVETSVMKNVRKPESTIAELLKAGKVTLRKFMSELKATEYKPTGRINTSCILIRVIK